MSYVEPQAGELFTVIIDKRMASNPALTWRNTYEALAVSDATSADLNDLAGQLVAFERQFHLPAVEFTQFRVSTLAPDSDPYNPENFITVPLAAGLNGLRVAPGQIEPLQMCFYVKRQVASGRQGKILYRGVLDETAVESPSGVPRLTDADAWTEIVGDAIAATTIDSYFMGGASNIKLCMAYNGVTASVRLVQSFVASGVTIAKYNHKYYDQPSR